MCTYKHTNKHACQVNVFSFIVYKYTYHTLACMYIYAHMYTHICIYIYTYICKHVCIYVLKYYADISAAMCARVKSLLQKVQRSSCQFCGGTRDSARTE